ncbi:DUF3089 domain-containing protein [Sphingomonas bacterium]|uniref:DUF3089 domain-containing protein n=1 Tax=Sphingomonas bacterium TaxID=1895847 RepID=UPI00157752FD|nr:DUF3089 domain-containing protein [Sphingomonas bacterium]
MKLSPTLLPLIVALGICGAGVAQAQSFAEQTPPPPPDYALASSWAAGPFGPGASAVVPKGATPASRDPAVDVFYVYPTTFRSTTVWNQDLADATTDAWTDVSVIARQASIFNACCRVFAPRYRQASFRNVGGERDKALDLAYQDVARAFDHYLTTQNRGRPFILAGHSQGAWMIARLLEEKIDGTPLQDKLVAAYIVGINLAEGDFGRRFKHVLPCATPDQTGCAVQWNSVLASADLTKIAAQYQAPYVAKRGDDPGKVTLCVNPLTFDRSKPAATTAQAQGAVPGDPGEGPLRPLLIHAVAAHCAQGLLIVDPSPALALKPIPGGAVMHYHDLGLFYADVRANAARRVKSYLRTLGTRTKR